MPRTRSEFSSHRFIFLIAFFAVACMAQAAFAEWKVRKNAEVRNSDKYMFRVTRDNNGVIRGWLILPKDMPGAFDAKLPIYQVDDNKVREIPSRKQGTSMDREKKRWIAWKISETIKNPAEALIEIMVGREITFQYYMPDGTIYETSFSLEGAEEAIEEILSDG